MAEDDLWHVRLAPDDVKQLTLEQLDDLFRLEVIEASTLIWQPGMTEWLPLSVVAGLGEEDPDPVSIAVSEPPPAAAKRVMAQTATSWPPRAEPAASWPPQARSAPPPRTAPPPPSMRAAPAPSRAPAPVASSWPPANAWSNPPPRPAPVSAYASTVAEPQRSAPPPSVAPPRYVDPFGAPPPSIAPPPPSIAPYAASAVAHTQVYRQGGGGWLVALAFAAGLAVTLYRNDIVHAAARNIGQETTYLKLEQALGGPSFGTPRAVESMAAAAAAISTSPLEPATPAALPTSASTTATPAATTTTAAPAPAETATPSAPAATATEAPAAKPAPAPPPRSAPVPAHRTQSSQAAPAVDPVFKTTKKKGKGNEYDPLNGSL